MYVCMYVCIKMSACQQKLCSSISPSQACHLGCEQEGSTEGHLELPKHFEIEESGQRVLKSKKEDIHSEDSQNSTREASYMNPCGLTTTTLPKLQDAVTVSRNFVVSSQPPSTLFELLSESPQECSNIPIRLMLPQGRLSGLEVQGGSGSSEKHVPLTGEA